MKPRIYLYYEDETGNFKGNLISHLNGLESHYNHFKNSPSYIHVGFKPASSDKVRDELRDLPAGLYCSRAFISCEPGETWKASEISAGNLDYGLFYLFVTPYFSCEIPHELKIKNVEVRKTLAPRGGQHVYFEDCNLLEFDWSVRTANVLKNYKIELISDLIQKSEDELLKFKNFGRKSLTEINKFLSARNLHLAHPKDVSQSQYKPIKEGQISSNNDSAADFDPHSNHPRDQKTGTNFIEDITAEFRSRCSPRYVDVIEKRLGIHGEEFTLEAIGVEFNVTRERVRQLEKKAWAKILNIKNNIFAQWYEELVKIVTQSVYPINLKKISELDRRFPNTLSTGATIEALIKFQNRTADKAISRELHISSYDGQSFVGLIETKDIEALQATIIEKLHVSVGRGSNEIKSELIEATPTSYHPFLEMLWANFWARSLTLEENGEVILVKYIERSEAEKISELLIHHLESTGETFSNDQIEEYINNLNPTVTTRTCMNLFTQDERIFNPSHGTWSAYTSLNVSQTEFDTVFSAASRLMKNANTEFHSREVLPLIDLSREFDEFIISAVLRNSGKFQYLGRNVFTSLDSELENRTKIHDVFVKILKSEGRPLHATEMVELANRYRSIDPNMMINAQPPLKALGQNFFGLDFWEEEILHATGSKPPREIALGPTQLHVYEALQAELQQKDYLSEENAILVASSALSHLKQRGKPAIAKKILDRLVRAQKIKYSSSSYILPGNGKNFSDLDINN